jgi:cobalamin synthase
VESSAIINSGVVLGNLFIAISSILLQFLSPDKLQFLYNNGKIYWISMYALAIIICMLRYYYHSKNALSSMVEEFKRRGWGDKGLFLFFVSTVLLIASFAILFLISQYLKKQGIANHGDF